MKQTPAPTRIIQSLCLLTFLVLTLMGMWRSSTTGLKSGLTRFGKVGSNEKEIGGQVGFDGTNSGTGKETEGKPVGGDVNEEPAEGKKERGDKLVVAHFMLGNTYPYTPSDWTSTLTLAAQTGLDALSLNLGPEVWQWDQARAAYSLASEAIESRNSSAEETESGKTSPKKRGLRLFLSLDMNVLPSHTLSDMHNLVDLVLELGDSPAQLRVGGQEGRGRGQGKGRGSRRGKVVLSTFGGGEVSFGGAGWEGFLTACRGKGTEIFFIPAFFLPPETILAKDYLDGVFSWNAAWPQGNYPTSTIEDRPFIKSDKSYMAAVSPWFFTHYGKTGDWAWNKNWIYRSDDHLYVKRWLDILDPAFDPDFVQIISWNDYGESHYIGPIVGAQPGSQRWTEGMSHEGWRKMTEWFIRRYKGVPLSSETETRVYLSYRLSARDCEIKGDEVGRPDRAEFAQDVISVTVTMPEWMSARSQIFLVIEAGDEGRHEIALEPRNGIAMALVPFRPGDVSFTLWQDGKQILTGKGEPIRSNDQAGPVYNFNAWTGSWAIENTD